MRTEKNDIEQQNVLYTLCMCIREPAKILYSVNYATRRIQITSSSLSIEFLFSRNFGTCTPHQPATVKTPLTENFMIFQHKKSIVRTMHTT